MAGMFEAAQAPMMPQGPGGEFDAVFPGQWQPVSWTRFGAVIPVLAGSSGAGASSVAMAIADAITQDRRAVLVVDADDPARSGLAVAAREDGPWTRPVTDDVQVRYSWRGRPGFGALLARMETTLPAFTAGMVPSPPDWLPDPPPEPLHVVVADLGWGGWRAAGSPIAGAGGWLRAGDPAPRPVLVVRATRPSLRQAEQVLARLEPWVQVGAATPVCQLVVVGAKRWPAEIDDTVVPRVSELLDDAVFVPCDAAWEQVGVTDAAVPRRVVDAVRPVLASWGVIGLLPGSPAARRRNR